MWIEDLSGTLINLAIMQDISIEPNFEGDGFNIVARNAGGAVFIITEFYGGQAEALRGRAQDYLDELKRSLGSSGQLLSPTNTTPRRSGTTPIRPQAFGLYRPD